MSDYKALVSDDVHQGVILWLPKRDQILARRRSSDSVISPPVRRIISSKGIDEAFYYHPIVVISRPATDPEKVHFLLRTTFNGQPISERNSALWWRHMSMAPQAKHPLAKAGNNMYRTLKFKKGRSMEKGGYVDVSNVYEMDWKDAQRFWTGPHHERQLHCLGKASFRALLATLATTGPYEPSRQFDRHAKAPPNIKLSSTKAKLYLAETAMPFEGTGSDDMDLVRDTYHELCFAEIGMPYEDGDSDDTRWDADVNVSPSGVMIEILKLMMMMIGAGLVGFAVGFTLMTMLRLCGNIEL